MQLKSGQIIKETWKVFDSSGEMLSNDEETQFALDRFSEIILD